MDKITLLDGGMGQELLRRSAREVSPLWSADVMLHEPDLVRDLHCDFIDSGARVITLNTYTATPQRLARENELGQLCALHRAAMDAALGAVEISGRGDVAIAGCLPPLVASYRPDVSLSFEDALESYRRLVDLQVEASDIFLCETMASVTEARAACMAALESGKPVWVALSVCDDKPEQLRSGELLSDALSVVGELGVDAVLLNCSHPEAIDACVPQLSGLKQKFGAYANGFVSVENLMPGGTVEKLKARTDLNPQQYADYALGWVRDGASIVGGCCEVGPAHIRALQEALVNEGFV